MLKSKALNIFPMVIFWIFPPTFSLSKIKMSLVLVEFSMLIQVSYAREDDNWWLLPTILLLFKAVQARFVDWHIANLEVQDFSLFTQDPDTFWAYEAVS